MSWAIGLVDGRDVGYGVPAWCEHDVCSEVIDRGLSYVCGGDHGGGDHGCGLYFCSSHLFLVDDPNSDGMVELCERCADRGFNPDDAAVRAHPYFKPKPDHPDWVAFKLTDESWAPWRAENPDLVERMRQVRP